MQRTTQSILRQLAARSPAALQTQQQTARLSSASGGCFNISKDGNVAILTLDVPGEKVNTMSTRMVTEFGAALDTIANDDSVKSAVVISGKADNFIAGADITELAKIKTAADGEAMSKGGQVALDRLSNFPKPVVAAVHGACLGGGLEFAMACSYRVATESPKTKMGLPEVKLGLLPGAGGTQRLPALVGLQQGLTMIMTGKELRAQQAKRAGLVDQVADPFALRSAAIEAAQGLANGTLKRKGKKAGLQQMLLEKNPLGRQALFKIATDNMMKMSGGNYPALPKIIDAVRAGADGGMKKGLAAEAKGFGELTVSSESAALQGLFFGSTALKKNRFGKPEGKVKKVGVLGAGLMGAGVAEVTANKGIPVLLKDLNHEGLARGLNQIDKNLSTRLKKRRMTKFKKDLTMSAVTGLAETDNWQAHFKDCDLVVEAVLEELSLKHRVMQQMEEVLPESAVLATNTSAIPIRDIAAGCSRPENVLGMHYFSPVDKMMLLEIITHEGTSKEAAAKAVDLGIKQGKTVIVCKDVPGFYVNRSLGPYMCEVMALLQAGVPAGDLEKAMKAYGFPVGPITLFDEVGMDVAAHVSETLLGELDCRTDGADPAMIKELVAAGLLGRKAGKGFFSYEKNGKRKGKDVHPETAAIIKKYVKGEPPKLSQEVLQQRMAFRFINEALFCLQDGIIESPVDGDVAAVFGIGFSPFRGGPFREVDSLGAQKYVDTMNGFAAEYGPQFKPAQIVVDMAKEGKKFHQ